MGSGGSVEQHYKDLSDTVVLQLKWLEYSRLKLLSRELQMLPEDAFFPKGHPNSFPEAYILYKKCSKWGNWWPGGLADQPAFLYSEFLVCESAEARFQLEELPALRNLAHADELHI